MTEPTCGAALVLREGGPVQVPFRACCAAALLHAARAQESPPCPRQRQLVRTGAQLTPGDEVIS